jgi:hypothetical protein
MLTDGSSKVRHPAALPGLTETWLRDEEADASERALVMGAGDRPDLTASDHSISHPVES